MDQGEFTRQDKVEQLEGAVERIQENNAFLRDKARYVLHALYMHAHAFNMHVTCLRHACDMHACM